MIGYAFLYLAATNMLTFAVFRHDKAAARAGISRVRESDLLLLAMIGGSIGAFAGRHHFRHKTRKEPFSTYLQIVGMIHAGLVAGLGSAFVADLI